ncbi:MAG: hypothetical protein GX093_02320 [Xanthomonadaceae bacterium]|nr:hypothetical protein [Xanthomonadaceae bacterium]
MLAALLAAFGYWRQQVGPTVTVADQGEFVAMPNTTPFAGTLDPRAEDPQLDLPFEDDETGGSGGDVVNMNDFSEEVVEDRRA